MYAKVAFVGELIQDCIHFLLSCTELDRMWKTSYKEENTVKAKIEDRILFDAQLRSLRPEEEIVGEVSISVKYYQLKTSLDKFFCTRILSCNNLLIFKINNASDHVKYFSLPCRN
jgi:hypothetical protein